MASPMGIGQPIFILPEGTLRTTGRDAQSRNIAAAKLISDSVRTTLGPKGMDKMLIDSIFKGELIKKAELLLEQEIHPTMIIRGFRIAKDKALEIVNTLSEKVTL